VQVVRQPQRHGSNINAAAETSTAATSREAATATAGNVQFNQFKSPG